MTTLRSLLFNTLALTFVVTLMSGSAALANDECMPDQITGDPCVSTTMPSE